MDDQIYKVFREEFKDYEIKLLREEDLKSEKAKEVSVNMRTCPVSPKPQWMLSTPVVLRHRRGAPSATSSKAWWKTSTTALCSAWTARGITQKRIPYLVHVHHLGAAVKVSKSENSLLQCVSYFQSPGFSSWRLRLPETERATTAPCSAPSKEPPPLTLFYENPRPTSVVYAIEFYCARYNSCLLSNNFNAA